MLAKPIAMLVTLSGLAVADPAPKKEPASITAARAWLGIMVDGKGAVPAPTKDAPFEFDFSSPMKECSDIRKGHAINATGMTKLRDCIIASRKTLGAKAKLTVEVADGTAFWQKDWLKTAPTTVFVDVGYASKKLTLDLILGVLPDGTVTVASLAWRDEAAGG